MARSIAVGLVILAVSTSAALAAQRTHHHARSPAVQQAGSNTGDYDEYGNMRVHPETPPVSGSNAALHAKTHRHSGYKPSSDYDEHGNVRVHSETPPVSGSNAALHGKTHRASGYKPSSDYDEHGNMRVH